MRSGQSRCAVRTGIPRFSPAWRASAESARIVARSAPGGATARGRVRSAGATIPSREVQKAGGSTNRTERMGLLAIGYWLLAIGYWLLLQTEWPIANSL